MTKNKNNENVNNHDNLIHTDRKTKSYEEDAKDIIEESTKFYPGSFISIKNECTTCRHFYRGCCTCPNDICDYEA